MSTSKATNLQPCHVAGESKFFFWFCVWRWDWWERRWKKTNDTSVKHEKWRCKKLSVALRFKQFFPFPFLQTWGPLAGPRVVRTATPELGRPHTRIKLLDCMLTSWMDMIKFDRIMKIFPGPSSIGTIKSLLKPWKPTVVGVELLLRARVLEAALFVAGGAYFCITWCFSQLLCSWTEFLYASDSHS